MSVSLYLVSLSHTQTKFYTIPEVRGKCCTKNARFGGGAVFTPHTDHTLITHTNRTLITN